MKNLKNQKGVKIETPTDAEDLLPLEPTPGPSRSTHHQTRAKRREEKAKTTTANAPAKGRKTESQPKANAVRTVVSKKRKVN
jgi:hypothetical protein